MLTHSRKAYTAGIALRFGLHKHPESNGIYIAEYLFVTLSPCGFIAAEYVLLGRLSRWLGASAHVLIPPQKITRVFVLSDVTTFLIQVCRYIFLDKVLGVDCIFAGCWWLYIRLSAYKSTNGRNGFTRTCIIRSIFNLSVELLG